jgi:hypothetical protein
VSKSSFGFLPDLGVFVAARTVQNRQSKQHISDPLMIIAVAVRNGVLGDGHIRLRDRLKR